MNDQNPQHYNADWQHQPQASYPAHPAPYNGPQQVSGYPSQEAWPQQPAPYQHPYFAPPPQAPAYQVPGNVSSQPMNININNVQNGYPQQVFDPYRGHAVTALTMGIIAITIWIIPFLGSLISLICAIIGIANGIQGHKSITRAGSATTGLILSIVSIVLMIGTVVIFLLPMIALILAPHAIR